MTLTMVISLFGGLGLFIYGMHLMSDGLKIVAGNRMKRLLEVLTNNMFKAILVGTVVTMIVQSSSTTTVMVVGFVNASLMSLLQAAGVILGANIGTTITAQLIAFNITAVAPVFIGVGTIMCLFAKKKRMRDVGSIVLGFGILFFGISTMSASMSTLKDSPEFVYLLSTYGMNPFLGLLIGTVITAIMQSSSATVGLLQALAISGVFSGVMGTDAIKICIPIMIGTNIGTCVTALLSSIGTSITAKKAAVFHLFVNIFGAVWVMAILLIIDGITDHNPIYQFIVNISGTTIADNGDVLPNVARQIAMVHTFFNVANMLVIFPFVKKLVNFLDRIMPNSEEETGLQLDSRLLNNPAVALGQVSKEVTRLATMCSKNFVQSCDSVLNKDDKLIEKVCEREERIDKFEHGIIEYVVQMSNLNMTEEENDRVAFYMKGSHDLERIGDHAKNISELAEMRIRDNVSISELGNKDMQLLIGATGKILDHLVTVLQSEDTALCHEILKEEDNIDVLTEKAKDNHIERLNSGVCNAVAGIIYFDMLSNIERISDHASNIATGLLELQEKPGAKLTEEVIY